MRYPCDPKEIDKKSLKKKWLYPHLLITWLTVVRDYNGEAIDSKRQSEANLGKKV
jgi:hypothetical protein